MRVSLQGPLAGVVLAALGLYLLLAPVERLAQKRSPLKRKARSSLGKESVPVWMRMFFRGLGLMLLVLAIILLMPLIKPAW